MTTFQEHKPNINDRLNWVKKGFKVFCCDCWWIGREIDYDSCPDCKSENVEKKMSVSSFMGSSSLGKCATSSPKEFS